MDHSSVTFEDLRNIMNIDDHIAFNLYLEDIFKELVSKKKNSLGVVGIHKKTFIHFLKLPIAICEKIFDAINRDQPNKDIAKEILQYNEFKKFLNDLYVGSFENTAKLVFKIYDFDNSGIIKKKDVKHIFSFVPLKHSSDYEISFKEHEYQIDSLNRFDQMLKDVFHHKETMDFEEFLKEIEINTEFFLQFLCFLYITLPITSDSLWIYDRISKKSSNTESASSGSSLNNTPLLSPRISLKSRTNFSPMGDYIYMNNTPVTRMKMKLHKLKGHSSKTITPLFTSDNLQTKLGFGDSKKRDSKKKLDYLATFSTSSKKNLPELSREDKEPFKREKEKSLTSSTTYKSMKKFDENLTNFPLRSSNHSIPEVKNESKNDSNQKMNSGNIGSKKYSEEDVIQDEIMDERINITPFDRSVFSKKQHTIFEEDVEEDDEKEKELFKAKSRKASTQKLYVENKLKNPTSKKTSIVERLGLDDEKKERQLKNPKSSKASKLSLHEYNQVLEQMEEDNKNFNEDDEFNNLLKNQLVQLSLNDHESDDDDEEEIKKKIAEEENKRERQIILMHSELLKFKSEKKTFKIFYIKLIHQNIYYYKKQNDPDEAYYKMHYLTDCFVTKNEPKVLKNTIFHSFSLNFSNSKMKKYYHLNEDIINSWISAIKKATGYKDFFDYYSIGEYLGKGQFGLVKTGINLRTKMNVALKILDKSQMSSSYEGLKTEIDILKVSKHPNVVQFLDYFENASYIFIVMELLRGGTLDDFMKKNNWKITEDTAKNIVKQLIHGLYYLKQFGIIHRDLKLNNIMLKNADGEPLQVKIMDFGLSKILGPYEKAKESCGTLSYIAPEIIKRNAYNSQVDIWSLGVLIYYMMSKDLPFDLPNNNFKEICNVILTKNLAFPPEKWADRSDLVKDFISKCLNRNPEKRQTIEEAMLHEWLN